MRTPTLFTLAAVLPVLVWTACASHPSTHDEVHVSGYAADKALCVDEATSYDAGEECFRRYEKLYAPFWVDAAVEAPPAQPWEDAGK